MRGARNVSLGRKAEKGRDDLSTWIRVEFLDGYVDQSKSSGHCLEATSRQM